MSDYCIENDGARRAELAAIHKSKETTRIEQLEADNARLLQTVALGRDALEHALFLLPSDANQRLGMEGALMSQIKALESKA